MRGRNKISAAAKLRTVLLFGELGDYTLVARALKDRDGIEISSTSVDRRLNSLNIRPGYEQRHFDAVVARLKYEVQLEKAAGIELPSRGTESEKLTPEEVIETLEAFVEKHNYHATAKKLGLARATVEGRLIGILGADRAHPAAAREKLAELKSEQ